MNSQCAESIETVLAVSYEAIKNPELCALFFAKLEKSFDRDQDGRVSFRKYAVAWRRIYIGKAFNGQNMEELAKKFDVSIDTIRRDLDWYRENEKKKTVKIPKLELL